MARFLDLEDLFRGRHGVINLAEGRLEIAVHLTAQNA
jgi:hypothetical protein